MRWGCLDYFKLLMRVPYNLVTTPSPAEPVRGRGLLLPPRLHPPPLPALPPPGLGGAGHRRPPGRPGLPALPEGGPGLPPLGRALPALGPAPPAAVGAGGQRPDLEEPERGSEPGGAGPGGRQLQAPQATGGAGGEAAPQEGVMSACYSSGVHPPHQPVGGEAGGAALLVGLPWQQAGQLPLHPALRPTAT